MADHEIEPFTALVRADATPIKINAKTPAATQPSLRAESTTLLPAAGTTNTLLVIDTTASAIESLQSALSSTVTVNNGASLVNFASVSTPTSATQHLTVKPPITSVVVTVTSNVVNNLPASSTSATASQEVTVFDDGTIESMTSVDSATSIPSTTTVVQTVPTSSAVQTTAFIVSSLMGGISGQGGSLQSATGSAYLQSLASLRSSSSTVISSISSTYSTSVSATTASTSTSSTQSSRASAAVSNQNANASKSCPEQRGAIAGAALGAGIAFGLAAFVFAFFFFRRRYASRTPYRHKKLVNEVDEHPYPEPKLPAIGVAAMAKEATPSIVAIDNRPLWERNLPQGADDITVRNRVKGLFDHVELHVEHFYSNVPVELTMDVAAGLATADPGSFGNTNNLADAFNTTRGPADIIKHCIAYAAVTRVQIGGDAGITLLPFEFAIINLLRRPEQSAVSGGYDEAMSRWRVLTARLRPPPATDQEYLSRREARVTQCADNLTAAFSPWKRREQTSEAAQKDLANILRSAAGVGIFLFAQPSHFEFAWHNLPMTTARTERRQRSYAVLPAFVKRTGEDGRPLSQAYIMIETMIRTV